MKKQVRLCKISCALYASVDSYLDFGATRGQRAHAIAEDKNLEILVE